MLIYPLDAFGDPFAQTIASVRRSAGDWGVIETQVALTVAFSS